MKRIITVFIAFHLAFSSTAQKLKILSMDSLIGKKCVWTFDYPSTFSDNHDGTVSVNIGAIRTDSANVPLDCTPSLAFSQIARMYSTTNGQYVNTACMPMSDSMGIIYFSHPESNGDMTYFGHYNGNTAIEKRDANDNFLWLKHYGSTSYGEGVTSFAVAQDGGFFIVTASVGDDGDVGLHYGSPFELDIWVLRVDNDGEMLWGKVLGGTGRDIGTAIYASEDGGCYIIGATSSNDHDVVGYKGGGDVFVARLDSLGNIVWTNCYGGSGGEFDYTSSIFAEPDGWGGFYILSRTDSDDGDVKNKTDKSPDYWLVHIDKDGNILWERNYGSDLAERPAALCRGANGNLWLGGSGGGIPDTVMGDILEGFGGSDVWILQVDTNGSIINQRTLGTNQREELNGLYPMADGTVLAAGRYFYTAPRSGKRSPGFPITSGEFGYGDAFVAHLSPDTDLSVKSNKKIQLLWSVFPNPTDGNITVKVEGTPEKYAVSITDLKGNSLYRGNLQNNKLNIDTHSWANGIYTITLSDNKGNTATKKVTVKK